jgi:type IV pilus assembly protein PilV
MVQSLRTQSGIALIEAMVAVFIFSIGILAVIGLQATSMRTSSDAKYRADAAFLADQIIGQMWADQGASGQANLSTYVTGSANCALATPATTNTNLTNWLNTVNATLPGAAPGRQRIQFNTTGTPPVNQVTVTICWETAPGATTFHNHVITARINNNS